jgi:hypothetical protein
MTYAPVVASLVLVMVGAVIVAASAQSYRSEVSPVGVFILFSGVFVLFLHFIFYLVTVHKIWQAIQPIKPRTSAGAAVGLLLVPVFNWYWVFQAYWGWVQDYNKFLDDNNLEGKRIPEGLGITMSITKALWFCYFIPVVNSIYFIAATIVEAIYFSMVFDGINQLADKSTK